MPLTCAIQYRVCMHVKSGCLKTPKKILWTSEEVFDLPAIQISQQKGLLGEVKLSSF